MKPELSRNALIRSPKVCFTLLTVERVSVTEVEKKAF